MTVRPDPCARADALAKAATDEELSIHGGLFAVEVAEIHLRAAQLRLQAAKLRELCAELDRDPWTAWLNGFPNPGIASNCKVGDV